MASVKADWVCTRKCDENAYQNIIINEFNIRMNGIDPICIEY